MQTLNELPHELEIFRENIVDSLQQYNKLVCIPGEPSLFDSKLVGQPYWPQVLRYPMDNDDKPMKLLAQINFSDMPKLFPFPEQGILQIFLSVEDDFYGINFDDLTKQNGFRVVYHDEPVIHLNQLVSVFSYLTLFDHSRFPVTREIKLGFEEAQEPISVEDYRAIEVFRRQSLQKRSVPSPVHTYKLRKLYNKLFPPNGHKIGGYPYFTLSDPRGIRKSYHCKDLLLMQIDSDPNKGICFGDRGTAHFFISSKDLINRDFSNVLYNWDGH